MWSQFLADVARTRRLVIVAPAGRILWPSAPGSCLVLYLATVDCPANTSLERRASTDALTGLLMAATS